MNKQEFLALPKPEAVKYAFKMLRSEQITKEQYNRMISAVNNRQNQLIKDVQEVFELKEDYETLD